MGHALDPQRHLKDRLAVIVVASAVAGSLYSITQALARRKLAATGRDRRHHRCGGPSCIIGFELFGARRSSSVARRLPLIVAVFLRTAVYGVVIMAALLVFPWLIFGACPARSGQAWPAMSCSPSPRRLYLSR